MAVIRNSNSKSMKLFKKKGKSARDEDDDVMLPTKPTSQAAEFDDYSLLIHGEKKIGKTTLALEPDPAEVLMLQFDPPQISYKRMEIVVRLYPTFEKTLKELERKARKGTFPYKRIVIDRCDAWFRLAEREACDRLAIEHASEEAWGKGWAEIRKIFTDAVDRVLSLPCGKWFLCHSDWKEIEGRSGKIIKLLPNLTSAADEILNGKVDGWFAYAYRGQQRVLVVKGDERTGAGHRIRGHFLTKKGEPLEEIPMGDDPEEAFVNLMRGYNNELSLVRPIDDDEEDYTPQRKVKKLMKNKK